MVKPSLGWGREGGGQKKKGGGGVTTGGCSNKISLPLQRSCFYGEVCKSRSVHRWQLLLVNLISFLQQLSKFE